MKPQYSGIIIKTFKMKPKKPNSALRLVCQVNIKDKVVLAYIPGEKGDIIKHSKVLLIPKGRRDLPGIHYTIIRGKLDSVAPNRKNSRSKYGKKKNT